MDSMEGVCRGVRAMRVPDTYVRPYGCTAAVYGWGLATS